MKASKKDMAPGLASWELDPFFAAAEDVQQSADRMESLYRTFLHSRVLAEGDTIELKSAELSWRELATAIDTAKWQLEEFEKAVTECAQLHGFQMGEDAPKRHFSFIDAIKDQISMIENALRQCIDPKAFNSLHLVDFNDDERHQLALFLSGCTYTDIFTVGDDRIHPIEESDVEGISSFTPLKPRACCELVKNSNHRSELECTSSNTQDGTCGSGLFFPSNQSVGKGIEAAHDADNEVVQGNGPISHEIVVREKFLKGSACKNNACNSFLEGKFGSNVDDSNNALIKENLMINSDHLDSLLKTRQVNHFQSPTNVFKRWKNGYQGISVKEEGLMANDDGSLLDMEEGVLSGDSRSSRKVTDGHREKHPVMMEKWIIKQLLCSCFRAALRILGRRATLIVMASCLFCMYLWFLSTLVPYMSTVFPYKFLD